MSIDVRVFADRTLQISLAKRSQVLLWEWAFKRLQHVVDTELTLCGAMRVSSAGHTGLSILGILVAFPCKPRWSRSQADYPKQPGYHSADIEH